MKDHDNLEKFSPFIEHVMPNASIKEKLEAQGNLENYLGVMNRTVSRQVAEGRTSEDICNMALEADAKQSNIDAQPNIKCWRTVRFLLS